MTERSSSRHPSSEAQATTVETFKCWSCGRAYPTEGKPEGQCPSCGQTCNRDRCEVVLTSNQGY